MDTVALAWRAEDAFFQAWPALRETTVGDWHLRFSEGLTRRANSANPRRQQVRNIEQSIAACESRYRAEELPAIFRIPSFVAPEAAQVLERLGYRAEGESVTLYADRKDVAVKAIGPAELLRHPTAEWLDAMARLQSQSGAARATYHRLVASISVPVAFALVRADDGIAALAYGAVHQGLLCYESVITDANARRRGHALKVLATLCDWAGENGAEGVCLQVEANNAAARALYGKIGLTTELYRYRYFRGAQA